MKVKLSEVSSGFTKNIAQKELVNNNGCYPIYGASGYIKDIDFYISDRPYIGIVKDGSGVGRVDLYPAYSSLLGTMQYVLPNENMEIGYLMYALRYMKLGTLCSGAAIPHIYYKNYKKNELNYREIQEQKIISTQLMQIEKAIDVCNAKICVLDELVKSRFIEMFGDIDKIDSPYKICKLNDVANVGSSHRVFTTEFVENGIPFYRGTEIGELANGKKPANPYYISEQHYHRLASDSTKPKIGDLLMPSICSKGQVWMVDTNEPFYYKDGRVLCISPNLSVFNPQYLLHFMRFKTEIEYQKLDTGPTFSEFKIFILKDFDVIVPPMSIQNEFAEFVKLTDKSKFIVQKQIEDLQELLDSKMDEYFG